MDTDKNKKIRPIAFYLPQYYPTPENDEWWEPGFTEWTNVAKAKPLFRGHYQPRIPQELGFYDLRVPETRERQAQLAMDAGIEGFCYWHYWFAGRRLLDRVFSDVVNSGKPDFPFCLCWANHSWFQKTWDPGKPDKLLIEQTYPGTGDYVAHFKALLPAFKDERYMKVNGKLIFGIFNSDGIPSFPLMKEIWNTLARENGLEGFWFFGLIQKETRVAGACDKGYDALVYENMQNVYDNHCPMLLQRMAHLFHMPTSLPYRKYVNNSIKFFRSHPDYVPCIMPDFDHTPRSSFRGHILTGDNPHDWGRLCRETVQLLQDRPERILFIKSWNEWGEGNYLEPDERFGRSYLDECRKAFISD